MLIASSDDMPWKPHPIPGIATKTLHVDRDAGFATRLYRIDAGASVPAHFHAGPEELLILSGDLTVHGHEMGPGDYCRADSDTVHHAAKSVSGAVLLVRASIHDRIIIE